MNRTSEEFKRGYKKGCISAYEICLKQGLVKKSNIALVEAYIKLMQTDFLTPTTTNNKEV